MTSKAKNLAIFLTFVFAFANFGCCNEKTRENPNPEHLIQKIVNYIIENGEQSRSGGKSVYTMITSDVDNPFFVEEATVVVMRKKKDFFIHGINYREDGAKMEEFDFYDYGANAKLNRYYGIQYDENGDQIEELSRDFDKNQECVNGVCETYPPEYFARQQLWYSRYYLAWMADDLRIED